MAPSSIVVIEDNEDFATILETVLRLWGYTVQCYTTLAAGAAQIGHSPPALLILDGQLPDGDGYSLYRRLRADAATSTLPILMLSVSDEVYQVARAAGDADPHLFVRLKPMPLDEMHTMIERVIRT
jgi:DNA-binding response OmpR family regulator